MSTSTTACAATIDPATTDVGTGDATGDAIGRIPPVPSTYPAPVIDVDDAVDQVRRGEPLMVADGTNIVLCLPAAVMDPAAAAAMAAHARITLVVPRSVARRFGLERYADGVAVVGDQRYAVTVAHALAGPHADQTWFRSDPRGPALQIVDDCGVAGSEDLTVLASELAQLAGFARVAAVVAVQPTVSAAGDDHRAAAPMLVAASLIGRALHERGPLQVSGPARLPLVAGSFVAYVVQAWDGVDHLVITATEGPRSGPTRVIRSCVIGQTFRSSGCPCRDELEQVLSDLGRGDCGAIVCLLAGPRTSWDGLASCPATTPGICSVREDIFADVAVERVRELALS